MDAAAWKTRLRCALNKSPEFQEIPQRSQLDISEPYKVYRIVPLDEQGEDKDGSYICSGHVTEGVYWIFPFHQPGYPIADRHAAMAHSRAAANVPRAVTDTEGQILPQQLKHWQENRIR